MPTIRHDEFADEDGIVHFRVQPIEHTALPPQLSRPSEVTFSVELLIGDTVRSQPYSTLLQTLAPYQDAIQEAIDSQAVYWADWSRPKVSDASVFPYRSNDSNLDRLLKAIQDRQVVSDQPNSED